MSTSKYAVRRLRRRPTPSKTTRSPWGACFHTCGSSIVEAAIDSGTEPFDHVVEFYRSWRFGPAYVMGYQGVGQLAAIYEEEDVTWHAGLNEPGVVTAAERRREYLSGDWRRLMAERGLAKALASWDERWPGRKSPQHLYPSRDPNADYVGVEMLPIVEGCGAEPARPGLRFTLAQHRGVALVYADLALRRSWGLPCAPGARLVGHEDVNPLARSDRGGMWDPGAGRYFSWEIVLEELQRV